MIKQVVFRTLPLFPVSIIYEVDDGDRAAYERKYQELESFLQSLGYKVIPTENSYDTIDWCVGHAIATPII